MRKQKILEDLVNSTQSPVLKVPTWELINNQLKASTPNLNDKDREVLAKQIASNSGNYMTTMLENEFLDYIGSCGVLVTVVPMLVTNLSAISSSVVGPAAPAAAPMIINLKAQGNNFKSLAIKVLSQAVKSGVGVPDAVLSAIKMIDKII